jgi:putative peptidoglycan binding protein
VSDHDIMDTDLEPRRFSVPEIAVGGIALAAFAFIGATMWWPQSPLPAASARGTTAPAWDAASAVTSPTTAGRSADSGGMSLERQPAEPAAAPDPSFLVGRADDLPDRAPSAAPSTAPDRGPGAAPVRGRSNVPTPTRVTTMQPVESRGTTALSGKLLDILRSDDPEDAAPRRSVREPTRQAALEPPERPAQEPPRRAAQEPPRRPAQESPRPAQETSRPSVPERNPTFRSDAIPIQQRLQELGYYSGEGDEKGVWGDSSRRALRDFKRVNGLQDDDKWDKDTETQLLSSPGVPANRTFIGRWALDANECQQREDGTQLVIDARGATAASGKCEFRSFKQDSASSWRVRAVCSAPGKSSWNTEIGLKLNGPQLQWSSERGTETYVRCVKPPSATAARTAAALPHEVLFCSGRCDLSGSVNALKDPGLCPRYCRPGATSALSWPPPPPPPPWLR